MVKRKTILVTLLLALIFCPSVRADETALFTTVAPDALIVLDLSGSMDMTPAGRGGYIASTQSCGYDVAYYPDSGTGHTKYCDTYDISPIPHWGDANCTGPYYKTSGTGHTTDCSRLAIAKRALFDVIDDNDSNTITKDDETSLNVRLGYMRFYNCYSNDTGGSYSSGCNSLIKPIGTKFSYIYCNNATSCTATSSVSGSISGEAAVGGTPLATALHEAKLYYDVQKAADSARACRQKFVILITDGADTFACGGSGTDEQTDQYKRRRESVLKAKALADAGYKVFVVGFGGAMPHWDRNTLNWMAYFGDTDNPLVANSGDTNAYNPAAVASCAASPTCTHVVSPDESHSYACVTHDTDPTPLHDPGETNLSGYAFFASSSSELKEALLRAIDVIREATYSFSQASVASSRLMDENYLYEGSF
ncbi:MAG: VWA domain-containing protein, partial [Deltaproteobacteria bacterium]|nr:VWA domain-containing protein [Deltaproteobacteria bacterium]